MSPFTQPELLYLISKDWKWNEMQKRNFSASDLASILNILVQGYILTDPTCVDSC